MSIILIYLRRRRIFSDLVDHRSLGAVIATPVALLACWTLAQSVGLQEVLPLVISGLVLSWISGFASIYGFGAVRTALSPLFLLLMFIPLPMALLESAQVALQWSSAEVTHILFRLIGIPVFRQGLVFSLPGVEIEVARECSGIRSTTVLLITALILGYLFLHSGWHKVSLVLLAIPIAIFKNALRIATLSWLGAYVSTDYLLGPAHHYSGLPVSALGFCIMIPTLLLLQHLERRQRERPAPVTTPPTPSPEPRPPTAE